jgi:hypothetical protein
VVLPLLEEIVESVVVVSVAGVVNDDDDDDAGTLSETDSTLLTAAESNDVESAGDDKARDDGCSSSSCSDGFTSDLSFWMLLLLGMFSPVDSPALLSFSLVLNDIDIDCNGALFLSSRFATAPVVDEVIALLLSDDETTNPIGGTNVTTPSSETMGDAVKSGVLFIIIDLETVNSSGCGC